MFQSPQTPLEREELQLGSGARHRVSPLGIPLGTQVTIWYLYMLFMSMRYTTTSPEPMVMDTKYVRILPQVVQGQGTMYARHAGAPI